MLFRSDLLNQGSCSTQSLELAFENSINVFPNPTINNTINLYFKNVPKTALKTIDLEIYDINGAFISKRSINVPPRLHKISFFGNKTKQGLYIFILKDSITKKIYKTIRVVNL